MNARLAALLLLTPALALAQGRPMAPDPVAEWEGPLDYAATGNTLLGNCHGPTCLGGGQSCLGLNQSAATLDVIPPADGLTVEYAQLTWFASLPQGVTSDDEVTLTPPGGEPLQVLADPVRSESFNDALDAGSAGLVPLLCPSVNVVPFSFYSNHAEVTAQLNAHLQAGRSLNGEWLVSNVDIPGADEDDPQTGILAVISATIGGWSLFVIYRHEALPLRRIYYYQGFELNSGTNRTVRARGFRAPPNPTMDLTYLVLEGDSDIQGDSLTVNGVEVHDACNPARNVFNGTVNSGRQDHQCNAQAFGVDLDSYTLDDAVQAGDEEANVTFVVPRGDGLVTAGEQIFTNWLILAFDHVPANFESLKPEKEASPPSGSSVAAGDEIQYLITVANNGGDFASNVVVTDAAPEGTSYLPNTFNVDRQPVVDDPGGALPMAQGFNLADLGRGATVAPGETHRLRFTVRVNDDVADGFVIRNAATIDSDDTEPVRSDLVVHGVGGSPPPPPARDGAAPPPAPRDAGAPPPPAPDAGPPPPPPTGGQTPACPGGFTLQADGTCERLICPAGSNPVGTRCVRGADATVDGGPCGPGQVLKEGICESACGAGLIWDHTCPGDGRCRFESEPACNPEGGGPAASGCGCDLSDAPTEGGALLLGLLTAAVLRRRR